MNHIITLIAAAGLSSVLALPASAESRPRFNGVKNTALVEYTDISSRYRPYGYRGYGHDYGYYSFGSGYYVYPNNYGYFYQPGYGSYYSPHIFGGRRFGWW